MDGWMMNGQPDGQTDRQAGWQVGRQAYIHSSRRTDRHLDSPLSLTTNSGRTDTHTRLALNHSLTQNTQPTPYAHTHTHMAHGTADD
mmetsp:Transcript_14664/g.42249  ORF Transcript_14664/g.42249 Transcript_14664/m.42249 type:complete len:87 (-) Transcript_14664:76-336(-)